jgi:pimeloyl-ACP methyl ester carboxylesterase
VSTPRIAVTPRLEPSAEVRAHNQVIRYHRSGTGPVVLLLGADDGASPLWPELLRALTDGFRLIVPVLPAADTAAALLADFLEGLGVAGVSVIASSQYCIPALELALRDVDQIARVVLVPDGHPAGSAWDGALATRAREAPVPLLVIRRGTLASEALTLLAHFLAGRAPGAPGS